jgi:glycosyltransferase involved in cell wall biosynthesis
MKILAIHNYYRIRSGEDLAFDATLATLRERGHAVSVLTRDNQEFGDGAFTKVRTALGSLFSIRAFWCTWRSIGRDRPEVALVQNVFPLLSPSVYWALRLRRVPVAQRVFNYRAVCPNGVLFTQGAICERCRGGAYWNAVIYRCYRGSRGASAAMAVSLGAMRFFGVWRWGVRLFLTPDIFLGAKIVPAIHDAEKIRVLFNPAPVHLMGEVRAAGAPKTETRGRDVLYVGRLVPEKGIDMVLECAKRLPDHRFRIVGTGEYEPTARKTAESLKLRNVEWLGPVYGDDLVRYYRDAGALVLPSRWYDNMPLVLTQALILGTPVVASRINGIPEFVIDGITGRLAEPLDADDFAAKISEVFRDSQKTRELSAEGIRRAREWFLPESFGTRLESILKELH